MCDCDFLPHYFYLGHLCVEDTFCCAKVCKLGSCVCKSVVWRYSFLSRVHKVTSQIFRNMEVSYNNDKRGN